MNQVAVVVAVCSNWQSLTLPASIVAGLSLARQAVSQLDFISHGCMVDARAIIVCVLTANRDVARCKLAWSHNVYLCIYIYIILYNNYEQTIHKFVLLLLLLTTWTNCSCCFCVVNKTALHRTPWQTTATTTTATAPATTIILASKKKKKKKTANSTRKTYISSGLLSWYQYTIIEEKKVSYTYDKV